MSYVTLIITLFSLAEAAREIRVGSAPDDSEVDYGETWLKMIDEQPNTYSLPSELRIQILKKGEGTVSPRIASRCLIHFSGWLRTGKLWESTFLRRKGDFGAARVYPRAPLTYSTDYFLHQMRSFNGDGAKNDPIRLRYKDSHKGQPVVVIPHDLPAGFMEAIMMMRAGDVWNIYMPGSYAYLRGGLAARNTEERNASIDQQLFRSDPQAYKHLEEARIAREEATKRRKTEVDDGYYMEDDVPSEQVYNFETIPRLAAIKVQVSLLHIVEHPEGEYNPYSDNELYTAFHDGVYPGKNLKQTDEELCEKLKEGGYEGVWLNRPGGINGYKDLHLFGKTADGVASTALSDVDRQSAYPEDPQQRPAWLTAKAPTFKVLQIGSQPDMSIRPSTADMRDRKKDPKLSSGNLARDENPNFDSHDQDNSLKGAGSQSKGIFIDTQTSGAESIQTQATPSGTVNFSDIAIVFAFVALPALTIVATYSVHQRTPKISVLTRPS